MKYQSKILKRIICIITLLTMLGQQLCQAAVSGGSVNINFVAVREACKQQYIAEFSVTSEKAEEYVENQNTDGTWDDVEYDDPAYRTFTAYDHLRRMCNIASSMHTEGHYLYTNKAEAVAAIERGIWGYYELLPPTLREDGTLNYMTSWWDDTIGRSLHFIIPLLLMTEGDISAECKEIGVSYIYDHRDMRNYPVLLTGANLVWYANNGVMRGIITENVDDVTAGMDRISEELIVKKDPVAEGSRPDGSFHQHGSNYYPGYGKEYLYNFLKNAKLLSESGLDFSAKYPVVADQLLNGYRYCTWGNAINLNVTGRGVNAKPSSTEVVSIIESARILAELYPAKAEELNAYAANLERSSVSNDIPAVVGNKYFWCSDYMVHNGENYSVTNRTVSDRTISSECDGTQNLYGSYMGFGTTFLSKAGDVHNGTTLFWDWGKLPGVTAPQNVEKITVAGTFMSQSEGFVGGVSDGEYGANMMKLNKWQTRANKAWFYFNDFYVALGNGISSARPEVATCVEQRGSLGELYVNGELISGGINDTVYNNVSTVMENNIGFVFPETPNITLMNKIVSGNWQYATPSNTDSADYTGKMFKMWFDHGDKPRKQSYEYIVLPETTASDLAVFANNIPVTIENSEDLQAVYSEAEGVGYAVFYKEGNYSFANGANVTVDKPCIVMLRETETDGEFEVSVATPGDDAKTVNVIVVYSGNERDEAFALPGSSLGEDEMGGSTVTKTVSF